MSEKKMVLYTGLGGIKYMVKTQSILITKLCIMDGSLLTSEEGLKYIEEYVPTQEDKDKLLKEFNKLKNETHNNKKLE